MNIRLFVLAGVFSLVPTLVAAQGCLAPDAEALRKDVAKYKNITVTVDDCIVQLNGQVNRLSDAWDVERKFRNFPWAAGVTNYLSVAGPVVDDAKLRRNVVGMINEEGYSDLRSPLGIGVRGGVVTLNGVEPNPMLLDSMLYAVASVRGVRVIVSNVQVDPLLNINELVEWTPRTVILWNNYVGPIYPRQ
jgi:osmotically-inducible protein OsmY